MNPSSKLSRRKLLKLMGSALLTPYLAGCSPAQAVNTSERKKADFWLGWYGFMGETTAAADVAGRGINTLMPYIGESKPAEVLAFLDKSQAAGVGVLLEIYRPLVESSDLAGVQAFVKKYQNHRVVAGWYLYDEPEIKVPLPLAPELLIQVYRAIKAQDGSRPVALVFADPDAIEPYSGAMDLLMWDNYPCNTDNAELSWAGNYRGAFTRAAKIAQAQGKPFINVLQAYQGHGIAKRLPSRAEFRYMFYLSLLGGTDGLFFWMLPWATPEWNEAVLYPTLEEVRQYLPAIVAGKTAPNIAPDNQVDAEVRVYPLPSSRKSLAIALNHGSDSLEFATRLEQPLGNKTTRGQRGQAARAAHSPLQVSLNPYEARLYEVEV